ncbi:MAG: YceI family protein [Ferruginibacter sp.]
MKTIIILLSITFTFASVSNAQNFFTKNGMISFFSKSPLENITGVNNQAVSVLNTATGDIKFSVIVKGFQFKKALMQEHFNENYMESAKYPKATFNGNVTNIGSINFTKDGEYKVSVTGDMMIHGVTKKVTAPAVITVKAGRLLAASAFTVLLSDYTIRIPKVVENNIAKTIDIKVDCNYEPK